MDDVDRSKGYSTFKDNRHPAARQIPSDTWACRRRGPWSMDRWHFCQSSAYSARYVAGQREWPEKKAFESSTTTESDSIHLMLNIWVFHGKLWDGRSVEWTISSWGCFATEADTNCSCLKDSKREEKHLDKQARQGKEMKQATLWILRNDLINHLYGGNSSNGGSPIDPIARGVRMETPFINRVMAMSGTQIGGTYHTIGLYQA